MSIKPIETVYNGYKFRSRLEARWAVFFDSIGVEYQYEPDGMVLNNGEYYLPDFYLPQLKTFVEIKPTSSERIEHVDDGVEFPKSLQKYAYAANTIVDADNVFLIAFGDPYDAFYHLYDSKRKGEAKLFFNGHCLHHSLMITDPDPTNVYKCESGELCSECDHYHYPCCVDAMFIWDHKGFVWAIPDRDFTNDDFTVIPFEVILHATKEGENRISNFFLDKMEEFTQKMMQARQARFEHGEKPIIN